jgi:hypothetical protein
MVTGFGDWAHSSYVLHFIFGHVLVNPVWNRSSHSLLVPAIWAASYHYSNHSSFIIFFSHTCLPLILCSPHPFLITLTVLCWQVRSTNSVHTQSQRIYIECANNILTLWVFSGLTDHTRLLLLNSITDITIPDSLSSPHLTSPHTHTHTHTLCMKGVASVL